MSISKDSPTGHLLTIRLIKSIFPSTFPRTQVFINFKISKACWKTSKILESYKIHWKQSHTFEISELVDMNINISYKSGFFSETDYGSCFFKVEKFSYRKGINCSEVENSEGKVQIFWAFVLEEERKGETIELLKMINETEAEREEVKFCKNKTLQKLENVKVKRKLCKEEINSLIQNFEPIIDKYAEREEIVITPVRRFYNSRTYDPNYQLYMNEDELR